MRRHSQSAATSAWARRGLSRSADDSPGRACRGLGRQQLQSDLGRPRALDSESRSGVTACRCVRSQSLGLRRRGSMATWTSRCRARGAAGTDGVERAGGRRRVRPGFTWNGAGIPRAGRGRGWWCEGPPRNHCPQRTYQQRVGVGACLHTRDVTGAPRPGTNQRRQRWSVNAPRQADESDRVRLWVRQTPAVADEHPAPGR